jgi:O-acetyl-ADP-ribose deacetylase (regulator of RNase III)
MKLLLVDINKSIYESFQKHFGEEENVEIYNCPFQELPYFDCMVSPANSFGQMNGGIDKHIRDYFGVQLEQRVQEYIYQEFLGEQPIGTSFIIETNNKEHPYLAHTPTMRIPMNIMGTENVFRAMKAMLIAVKKYNFQNNNVIQSIACSGLGTMIGGMDPDVAVRQMKLAYDLFKKPVRVTNWIEGFALHILIEDSTKIDDDKNE